jgi:hypothetical protein
MEEYIDELKKFYETKQKNNKGRSKQIQNPDIRVPYYYNKEYLRNIENKILEEKNKMIQTKYNILYGFVNEDSLELFDTLEENIKKLKQERDKIKLKIESREERKKKMIKRINNNIEELISQYNQIPEDRKEVYLQIEERREKINQVLNRHRCIILNEINKKKIFIVTNDYEPINGNELKDVMDLDTLEQSVPVNGATFGGSKLEKLDDDYSINHEILD